MEFCSTVWEPSFKFLNANGFCVMYTLKNDVLSIILRVEEHPWIRLCDVNLSVVSHLQYAVGKSEI